MHRELGGLVLLRSTDGQANYTLITLAHEMASMLNLSRLIQVALLSAAVGLGHAQTNADKGAEPLSRAQVKMDREEFLKTHRWDERTAGASSRALQCLTESSLEPMCMSGSVSTLLLRNLDDLSGEIDPARRRKAIDEVFHEDAVFYERSGVFRGPGTDFIVAREGKIAAVYLFFDKLP